MKAVVIHEHGGPEKLCYEEVDSPTAGRNEVVIRTRAIGVNHFDHDVREGISGIEHRMPHIMGLECAGEIHEVGEAVDAFELGDRVAPVFALNAGRCREPVCNCEMGLDNLCVVGGILGVTHPGTYAEFVKVTQNNVVRLPDALGFESASVAQVAMATAWNMIVHQIELKPYETVLINAAGSGIGSSAIQIARLVGARIIATAGSDEKLDRARVLGADEVVNYGTTNVTESAMSLTAGRGVDAVVDSVGGDILLRSLDALAWGGRLATCGAHAGEQVTVNVIEFFRKQITVYGTHGAPKSQINEVFGLVAAGKLEPIVHERFPLAEAESAHRLADSRQVFGKILLLP